MADNFPTSNLDTDDIIKATHFNELVTLLNQVWKGGSHLWNSEHNTIGHPRQFGWGQPDLYPQQVAQSSIVTAENVNHIIRQVNVMLWHIDADESATSGAAGAFINPIIITEASQKSSDPVLVELFVYNQIKSVLENYIYLNKFDSDQITTNLSAVPIQTTSGFTWNNDLECAYKATWPSYNDARHYFNAGGRISFSITSTGGSFTDIWGELFTSIGEIEIGAVSCTTSGLNNGILLNEGFYSMTPGQDYFVVFDASGFERTSYGEYGEYGYSNQGEEYNWRRERANIHVQSEYNSRRLRILLKGEEDPSTGEFTVYLKVLLIEDSDDTFALDNTIRSEMSYHQVNSTPIYPNYTEFYFKQGTTEYQFLQRINPSISMHQVWSTINVPYPVTMVNGNNMNAEIDWQANDPGNQWTNESGNSYVSWDKTETE